MDIQSVYPNFEITSPPVQTASGTVYKGMLRDNQGELPYKLLVMSVATKALLDDAFFKLGQATGNIYCKSTHDNYGYTLYILAEESFFLPPFFVEEQIEKTVKIDTPPPMVVTPPDLFEGGAINTPEKTKPVKKKEKRAKEKKRKWPTVLLILFLVLLLLGGATFAVLWYIGFFEDEEDDGDYGTNQPYVSVAPDSSIESSADELSQGDESAASGDESSAPDTSEESLVPTVSLVGISINTQPNKLEYYVGDSFDPSGMVITLFYSDGTSKNVTAGYTYSIKNFTSVGAQTVIIDYEEKTTTLTVYVKDAAPTTAYVHTGTWGALNWGIDSNGVLVISGNGKMDDLLYNKDVAWAEHRDIVTALVIEEGVTSIGNYAFFSFTKMLSVKLPSTLKQTGINSFRNCRFTTITFPSGLTTLKEDTFTFCTKLKTLNIPAGITKIDKWMFGYCYELEKINYDGTVAQWNALPKGENWRKDAGNFVVVCKDGTVTPAD